MAVSRSQARFHSQAGSHETGFADADSTPLCRHMPCSDDTRVNARRIDESPCPRSRRSPRNFLPGMNNAITDAAGVKVGHATIVRGESIQTGITAILPHDGNVFFDRVPAAVHTGNAFGQAHWRCTDKGARRARDARSSHVHPVRLTNNDMSALFQGVVEATEEAIYNSLFMATSVTQRGRTVEAIPLDRVREILARYNVRQR